MANELASKEVTLAAREKETSELEVTLSILRMNVSKLKEKLAKAEMDADAHTKSTTVIEAGLTKEKETCIKLQRELDEMNGKHSNLLVKLNDSKDKITSLEKEAQLATSQIRTLETKLAVTENELQQAKREAAESRKAKEAYKDSINDTQNTKKELRHLGMELLREQGNLEKHVAQQSAQTAVRTRKAERTDTNSNVDSNTVAGADEDLSSKVVVLQRRLIVEKEASAKLAVALRQKEDEVTKLKKSLELRMEGDVLQQELARLRAQIQLKDKEQRAAKAEVAALQAELTSREKEGKKREQDVLNALITENIKG